MHPILVRIPLPHVPLRLWWALAAIALLAAAAAAYSVLRREPQRDRAGAAISAVVALLSAGAAWQWRGVVYDGHDLPIYAYGVMLGVSLAVGWYVSLPLAERDGLPRDTIANCYVITALSAIVGARLLFVLANPDEIRSPWDVFALRNGGLVAYGGFIGGLLGSWAYLAPKQIRLLAWADDAVPSLASGLLITRIGCYLFGCDFGKRLPEGAPSWLKSLGTFPHWPAGTLANGDGSPAYMRHLDVYRGTPLERDLVQANASFPVHPTQLYESLVGALLLALVFWQRKHLRFRGQVFFVFTFAYGFLRFLLELVRDDVERGSYGPVLDEHVYVPACLVLFALGFVFGVSLGIPNLAARLVARVLAFLPAVAAFAVLMPARFAPSVAYQLSTSQVIALTSALAVSYFYGRSWNDAGLQPALAMSLGDRAAIRAQSGQPEPDPDGDDEDEDEDRNPQPEVGRSTNPPREVPGPDALPEPEPT